MLAFDFNVYRRAAAKEEGVLPHIVCVDGFTVSVQASKYNYCSPRVTNADSYTEVEAGFPSAKEPLLMPYAENSDEPTNTVYGWVPVEVINEVVAKHGGMANYEAITKMAEKLEEYEELEKERWG